MFQESIIQINELNNKLNIAVENEQYEDAAEIQAKIDDFTSIVDKFKSLYSGFIDSKDAEVRARENTEYFTKENNEEQTD